MILLLRFRLNWDYLLSDFISCKMASLMNGAVAKEQPLGNGYLGSVSGSLPKYKRRNVSATRTFPPKCGPKAGPISPEALMEVIIRSDDPAVVPSGDDNSVRFGEGPLRGLEEENRSVACGVVASVDNEFRESVVVQHPDPVAAAVEDNGVDTESKIETESKKRHDENGDLGLPNGSVDDVLHDGVSETNCTVKSDSHVDEVDGTKSTSAMEVEIHEAVESPNYLEQSESMNEFVGDAVAMVMDSMSNDTKATALDVKPLHIELPSAGLGGKSIVSNEVEPIISELKEVAVRTPQDKFPRRKVSAKRDFPPLCGKNAPPLTEEDRNSIFYETASSVDSKMGLSQDELKSPNEVVLDRGELKETLSTKVEGDSLVKEVDSGVLENEEDLTVIVNALMAPQNCPWVNEKAAVTSDDKKIEGRVGTQKSSLKQKGKYIVVAKKTIPKTSLQENAGIKKQKPLPSDQEDAGGTSDAVVVKDGGNSGEVEEGLAEEPPTVRKSKYIVVAKKTKPQTSMQEKSSFKKPKHSPSAQEDAGGTSHAVVVREEGNPGEVEEGLEEESPTVRKSKYIVVAKKTKPKTSMQENSSFKKQKHSLSQKDAGGTSHADEGNSAEVEEDLEEEPPTARKNNFTVNFPPFGANSKHSDARNKVRETLRLYQTICRKLLQGEEARTVKADKPKRIDLDAAKILKEKGVEVNADKNPIGSVPGVEVGDEFLYRVEMAIVGVHRLYQGGIDYVKQKNGMIVAASVVASGGYSDGWDSNADVLVYCGQGGNVIGKKQPEDQKLERGNLALANSATTKNPVRVIRGSKESKASDAQDSKSKMVVTYVYDGLYTVERYWQEPGSHGKLVYMFELKRIPGQPELAGNKLKDAKSDKNREGVCLRDISGGKELIPICAVNTIDDEKPPPFTYIRKMKYPKGLHLSPPQGCNCSTTCSESRKCPCILKNGGELPYNRNGAIVEVKPIVYECGPSCKCSSTCYNRVSQHGIKITLEIFKTENRGWGVRSLASITSGSFICEYVGELLEDKEAEQRTGSDEYLFDIGKNSIEESGYTIDAAQFGNVGRFINHSCSPNLYAQDVVYDHGDNKMPHVMFFAAENIPPLQELTYDYNYTVNQVRDSHGNIKTKTCYCGSTECSGRMY